LQKLKDAIQQSSRRKPVPGSNAPVARIARWPRRMFRLPPVRPEDGKQDRARHPLADEGKQASWA